MSSNTYDTRKYECCAPYFGEVGQEFTRRFKPEFEGALHGFVDDYASLYDHVVLKNDPGSAANPHAGTAAQQQLSQRAFEKRLKKSFGLIRRHVEDDTLRDEIDANAMGNGPDAWDIIVAAGTAQQTFLNLNDQDQEWENANFNDVGFDERTISNFKALLDRLNRERPDTQRKSNVQTWQKLLQCVRQAGHSELKLKATDQLQTPTFVHRAGALAGQPDIAATVKIFGERWRAAITDGSLKRQAPRKRLPPHGNRVDGLLAHLTLDDGSSLPVLLGQAQPRPNGAANERICWNCKGLGHMAKDSSGNTLCPSPAANRSYSSCINALETARKREGVRKSVRFVRRKPNLPKVDARLADNDNPLTLYVDDDGKVYTDDGVEVYDSIPDGFEVLNDAATNPEPGNDLASDALAAVMGIEDNQLTANSANSEYVDAKVASNELESMIDADFANAFVSPAYLASQENESSTRSSARRVASLTIGLIMAMGCGLALATRRSPMGAKLLLMACLGSAFTLPATNPRHCSTIMVSDVKLGAVQIQSSSLFNPRTGGAIDTGATKHASGKSKLFPKKYVTQLRPNLVVEMADNSRCQVELIGSMLLPVSIRRNVGTSTKKKSKLLVSDALLVPQLKDVTLISPKALFINEGIRTYFNDDLYMRTPTGEVLDFVETDRLYILPFHDDDSYTADALSITPKPTKPTTIDHLHAKFAHFSVDSIVNSQHCFTGVDMSHLPLKTMPQHHCEACTRAGMRRHRSSVHTKVQYTRFGQCVCSDTCDMGIYSIPFGFRYFLTFYDMATRYLFVYFLRTHEHAEVRRAYVQFMADAKPYLPKGYVEVWFTDNGSEFNVATGVGKDKPGFFANDADAWVNEYFTRRRFIVPWNPQQNPAESMNRVLLRPARACLLGSRRHARYWPFSIHQNTIVHNVLVSRSETAVHVMLMKVVGDALTKGNHAVNISPYMMVHGKPFNARFLEPLFCLCYCRITNQADLAALAKPEARSTPAIHLGLDPRRQGFLVYLIKYKRYTTAAYHDVIFPEKTEYPDVDLSGGELLQPGMHHSLPTEESIVENNPIEPHRLPAPHQDDNDRPAAPRDASLPSGNTRSSGQQVLAGLSSVPCEGFMAISAESSTSGGVMMLLKSDIWRPMSAPSTVAEAMAQDKEGWMDAYRKDFEAKMANGAFVYVDKPNDGTAVHPIGWAHKIVWNDDNTVSELRARLVGKGYKQLKGIDYKESYSSTPRITSIRVFLALVAAHDLETEHCDVIKAFTQNAVTDVDQLLVEQPPALPKVLNDSGEPMVLKCIMALEGFKQSGHLHQVNHSATFTLDNDVAVFTQLECEPTVFVYSKGAEYIAAIVWTDDVLFAFSERSRGTYERFLSQIYGKRWNFKRKGEVQRFAGLDISRNRSSGTVSISMEQYCVGIHRRFVPPGYPVRSLPAKNKESYQTLSVAQNAVERAAMVDKPYLAACASLIWLQTTLRADLSVHIATLCQVMHDPSPAAWAVLIDLVAYVHYSRGATITYSSKKSTWDCPGEYDADREIFEQEYGLHAFCDSSWKLKSLGGHLIFIAGGPIDWSTKLIRTVCHSSSEAEVAAGCNLAKALVYVRQLCVALGFNVRRPTPVFIDSAAAILIASNVGVTKRTLHFERWQHYLRLSVKRQLLYLIHVVTQRQRADGLTKVMDGTAQRWLYKTLFSH